MNTTNIDTITNALFSDDEDDVVVPVKPAAAQQRASQVSGQRIVSFSLFNNAYDNKPKTSKVSVDDFEQKCRVMATTDGGLLNIEDNEENKKTVSRFSPVFYPEEAKRGADFVEVISAFVMDVDKATPDLIEKVKDSLAGFRAWGWTTWSNGRTPGMMAMRFVVPFSRDIDLVCWRETHDSTMLNGELWNDMWKECIWKKLSLRFGNVNDIATKDCSRLHTMPGAPAMLNGVDNAPVQWWSQAGELLNVDELIRDAETWGDQQIEKDAKEHSESAKRWAEMSKKDRGLEQKRIESYIEAVIKGRANDVSATKDWRNQAVNNAMFKISQYIHGNNMSSVFSQAMVVPMLREAAKATGLEWKETEYTLGSAWKAGEKKRKPIQLADRPRLSMRDFREASLTDDKALVARIAKVTDDGAIERIAPITNEEMSIPAGEIKQKRGAGFEDLTDSGNAERWVRLHGDSFRFNADADEWMRWNGSSWLPKQDIEALRAAKDVVDDIYSSMKLVAGTNGDATDFRKQIKEWGDSSQSLRARQAMVSLAKAEPGMKITNDQFDTHPWLFAVQNGVVDLRTGNLLPHSKELYLSKISSVAFDKNAKCPQWEQFLSESLPDVDTRHWVHKMLGYGMSGIIKEHVFTVFWGPQGRNGKGVILGTVSKIIGSTYKVIKKSLVCSKDEESNSALFLMAQLKGARLAVVSELKDSDKLNESMVQSITGGDRLTARFSGQDFIEFDATHKMIVQTNPMPNVSQSASRALWTRMRIVPFTVSFSGREDLQLADKLATELPGILNWMIAGCLKWQSEGLKPSLAMVEASGEVEQESDDFGGFLNQYFDIDPSGKEDIKEIFKVFLSWQRSSNVKYEWDKKTLSRKLGDRGFKGKESNGTCFRLGLKLKFEAPPGM